MTEAFKQMEVGDLFSPDRLATFVRPREDNDTIIINTNGATDFHLTAETLRIIGQVLALSPSPKQIV